MKNAIQEFNQKLLSLVEHIGLLVIAIATVIAMTSEVMAMAFAKQVTLADLLLLFLYLEVLAMVGAYYRSGKLPVRFPLYIGMVALARYLVLDIKGMDDWRMLAVTGSILLLTLAVLMVRIGQCATPTPATNRLMQVRINPHLQAPQLSF
ncbi:MAG: phosphate-starvation-inducible PsiE family protein [Gallionella sp.]|nr:phosphate-starvation-inducible PsiE family protein [Gallionella sp.]